MTEQEWLNCTDPQAMLEFLRTTDRISDRKLRLCATACCRHIWHLTRSERARLAVETAERHADGLAPVEALDGGSGESVHTDDWACYEAARPDAAEAAAGTLHWAGRATYNAGWNASAWAKIVGLSSEDEVPPGEADEALYLAAEQAAQAEEAAEQTTQCALLRDIFGTPFAPLPAIDPRWLAWDGGIVKKLAEAIYDERAFEQMPIVADALEEAGCREPDLLSHCRQQGGAHVRGCWVIDLLLGKA